MLILLYIRSFIVIFFLIFLSQTNCYGIDNNISLYLPFDGNCKSLYGTDSERVKGVPKYYQGIVGSALLIGGLDNAIIYFPGNNYFDPTQGTIAFWVKPLDWDSYREPDQFQYYFFRLKDNAFLYRYWKDTVSFYCNFPNANLYHLYSAKASLHQGQWTHVALSWLNNIFKIYANGILTGEFMLREPMQKEWEGKGIQISDALNKKQSLIDEFYIFDYPLAASEINQIYKTSVSGNPPQLPDFKLSRIYVTNYPATNKASVCVDLKHASLDNLPVTAELFLINFQGKSMPLGTLSKLDAGLTVTKLIDLPKNLPAGQYAISARVVDAVGNEIANVKSEQFEKRVYPWEQVSTGLSDEVIPPFTPLRIKNNMISCWGREYIFKGDGFPEKIVTRREQILSNAITLEAMVNGLRLNSGGKIEVTVQKPGLIIFTSNWQNDLAQIKITCNIEYDGMMLYNVKIFPLKNISLDKMAVKIPIKIDNAKLYHVCRDEIRQNSESGYLPKGDGKIWGSSAKKSKNVLGTFVPYFWVGDYDRGICWMADSDKNWSVPDNSDCVEFFRDKQTLTALVNIISRPKVISTPWEISFALMAGPARPEPEGWRVGKGWSSWFYGQAQTLQGYGKPPDFPQYLKDVKHFKEMFGYWGVNTSPNDFWGVTEENKYFQLEWCGGTTFGYPLIHRNNFVMYTLDHLMSEKYVDGLYSDNVFPVPSTNLVTGAGYIRDDGKVQAGYSMFALRDFFKRSAYLFRKHHCNHTMMVHMTDSMIMPCYSFWDIKNDNEWGKNKPGVTDHIDAWSLGEICARSMSRQYGMAAMWHTPADEKNSFNNGDDLACLLLLHDILGRTLNIKKRTLPGKLLFGIGEPDVEFLGYWLLQPNDDPEKKDVKMSAWVRKKSGTALVVIANLTKADWEGKIQLPFKIMGLDSNSVALDAEGKDDSPLNFDKGELSLSIPHHNYRLLLIGPKGQFHLTPPPLETKIDRPIRNKVQVPKVNVPPPIFLKKIGEKAK